MDIWEDEALAAEGKDRELMFGGDVMRRWRLVLRAQLILDSRTHELNTFWTVAQQLYNADPDVKECFGGFEEFWSELRTGPGYSELFTQWKIPEQLQQQWNMLMAHMNKVKIAGRILSKCRDNLIEAATRGAKARETLLQSRRQAQPARERDRTRMLDTELDEYMTQSEPTPTTTEPEPEETPQATAQDTSPTDPTPEPTEPESQL